VRLVTDAHKYISVFISHSVENNEEARHYEKVLTNAGFAAFQYGHGLHSGDHIAATVASQIRQCHFFLFIVSDYSMRSEWVQRELGLALELRRQSGGYKPVIIPLYAKEAIWRKTHIRPVEFPTLDFETGERRPEYNLSRVRGLDKYANPDVDSDEFLVSQMKPALLVSRSDFGDESQFHETGVFDLYEELFADIERDDREDIVRWVLHSDLGITRRFKLSIEQTIEYTLDSRYFIMTLAGHAIGLAFFTYDASNLLVYGNYIAVHECWRATDLASAFVDKIVEVLGELFPDYLGIVFEVETVNRKNLERIVQYLEASDEPTFQTGQDRDEFRKARRIIWYQWIDCNFFIDKITRTPIPTTSPCLAPETEDWKSQEESYWLMWYNRPGLVRDFSDINELWRKAIQSIYIEVLAKSLVEAYPECGQKYWHYASGMVDRMLSEDIDVGFGRYFYRKDPLMRRMMKLRMNVPI
jgi:hypothetical protein